MGDRMKTAIAGGIAGLILAVFVFFFFRDPDSGFMGNLLLIALAPVGGFAGGWIGYKNK